MEWSERGSGVKSTVSDRVITIKWSNDSAEKGIETSFPIERSYSLDRGGGYYTNTGRGGKKKEKIVSPPDSSQKPRRRFFDPRGILSKNWNKSNCDKVSHVRRNKHGVYPLLLLELEGSGRRSF